MVGGTELGNRLNKSAGVCRVDKLVNSMTQIEDMTTALTVAVEDAFHFLTDGGWRGIKHRRVHIALQSNLTTNTVTRGTDIGCPVETQCITTGRRHIFEPLPTAFGEQNHRDSAAFVFADQAIDNLLHVFE